MTTDRLIGVREAAEILGVHRRSVIGYIRDHQLPARRVPGGAYELKESDVRAFTRPPMGYPSGRPRT